MSRHASVYSSNSAQILGQAKKIWKHFRACCLETIFNHRKDFTQVHGCRVKNLKIADFWKGPQGPSFSSSPAMSRGIFHQARLLQALRRSILKSYPSTGNGVPIPHPMERWDGGLFGHISHFQSHLLSNQDILLLNFF